MTCSKLSKLIVHRLSGLESLVLTVVRREKIPPKKVAVKMQTEFELEHLDTIVEN